MTSEERGMRSEELQYAFLRKALNKGKEMLIYSVLKALPSNANHHSSLLTPNSSLIKPEVSHAAT